ncbi:cytochrome c oxidase subunit II (mitochondrion) [Pogona vitticeps]|uniref:Cytochrome c oxidase subunit 2 n=1 Tax=Pogona vitticeps TaxID=103695 RepID=Q5CD62_9SAUR|nr:cytochrome c oxidase subunit II [Pogona vitticeps]BAD90950.1 cytochrome oxidase subunit 2 [Pogona vitticeps]
MAEASQALFNNAASPTMEELLHFHDFAMIMLMMIGTSIMITLLMITTTKLYLTASTDANQLEFMWTALPVTILIFIAAPSMRTLYLVEDLEHPHLTIKTLGHQWYWSYEYSDYETITFDSYMIKEQFLTKGSPRLLEVDNRMVFPTSTLTRLLISSDDVLHSWTLPAMGIKTDAVPGRLNQLIFTSSRPGVFYGQCSEICGTNHSFMPISAEAMPMMHFENWASSFNTS